MILISKKFVKDKLILTARRSFALDFDIFLFVVVAFGRALFGLWKD